MKAEIDPARHCLSQALGLCQAAHRLLARAPDSSGWVDRLRGLERELVARLDGMPLQPVLELVVNGKAKRPPWEGEEINWRVVEVWGAHCRADAEFWRRRQGAQRRVAHLQEPPSGVADDIRKALLAYDKGLLEPAERDRWLRESRVRAAGIGIYYDPWCTGTFPNGEPPPGWSGPYLEHDRPWRQRRGSRDPVLAFSELFFRERDLREATA